MAALSAAYPQEMRRRTYMQSRTIGQVLHAYTEPKKLEWLWNGLRLRHSMPAAMVPLMGSGTSPNEALRAEINRWFRNQPEVFPSTLGLQLEVARLGKLLPHNAAMYRPTLRQCSHAIALAASAAAVSFSREEWSRGGEEGVGARPLSWKRKALQARLSDIAKKRSRTSGVHVVLKRPARRIVHKRPAAKADEGEIAVVERPADCGPRSVKRTPFNLQRRHE